MRTALRPIALFHLRAFRMQSTAGLHLSHSSEVCPTPEKGDDSLEWLHRIVPPLTGTVHKGQLGRLAFIVHNPKDPRSCRRG